METDTHRARGRHKPAMRHTPCGVTGSLRGVRRCRGSTKLSPAMKPDPKDPLAVWADQALRQLPARRAPATLAPRVLAASARQKASAWHQRPWLDWPRHFQLLSLALFAGLVGAVVWFLAPHADAVSLANAKQSLAQNEGLRTVSIAVDVLSTLGSAMVMVLRSAHLWVIASACGAMAFLWCSCVGLGTACWRLAGDFR